MNEPRIEKWGDGARRKWKCPKCGNDLAGKPKLCMGRGLNSDACYGNSENELYNLEHLHVPCFCGWSSTYWPVDWQPAPRPEEVAA